ncbi:malate/lactate/ureidoglycolate dehydrogenase [Acerihabitans arboris]|uniref:Malate/lactate/ureidoglycolate dehydrogenase n=1 Tax=Acerihabitans arboris TaxID=2691583 RepID=A0A845SRI8_9GAMM|nr:malate/lactate/ureidoglycolate dehydrogenase [Acerihabitans arboris]NDL65248.1 malate/lactate/ureidoglycolate dehydrogenase [Acerihabitans arboris]
MPIFQHPFLRDYVAARLTDIQVTPDVAATVADNLVDACLKGHDSHGVTMLPRYIAAISEGGLRPQAQAVVTLDAGAVLSFNGGQGFGQVVGRQAITAGIARAKEYGVAVIGLADAHHLGRIGAWAEQAARAGLVSIHFANVNSRSPVMPWQGQQPRLGTNPFCVGIPVADGRHPLILDFATSIIAGNKARLAWNAGRPLAPGCIVDDRGQPAVDPRWLMTEPFGALLPFGEHKGSGLSVVCSLLGAALTGGMTERHDNRDKKRILNSMLSIIIDPEKLGGAGNYQQEIAGLLDWVRSSREDGALLLPGDAEQEKYEQRLREGIDIDATSWAQLAALEKQGAATF